MNKFELLSFASADELAHAAASAWLEEIAAVNRAGETHCVALSGGRIAQIFFAAVMERTRSLKVSFERVHFFWADERCVPPEDAESNFAGARKLLFAPLKISDAKIHRVRGEDSPAVAAKKAAEEICRIAPLNSDGQPVLDLIFLGLGEDGHTASLFPGEPESALTDKAVYRAIHNSPKPPPNRVTLGYPAIAAARQVWMLASGAGKAHALADSLKPTGQTSFARVLKMRPATKIFTDIHPALS